MTQTFYVDIHYSHHCLMIKKIIMNSFYWSTSMGATYKTSRLERNRATWDQSSQKESLKEQSSAMDSVRLKFNYECNMYLMGGYLSIFWNDLN